MGGLSGELWNHVCSLKESHGESIEVSSLFVVTKFGVTLLPCCQVPSLVSHNKRVPGSFSTGRHRLLLGFLQADSPSNEVFHSNGPFCQIQTAGSGDPSLLTCSC